MEPCDRRGVVIKGVGVGVGAGADGTPASSKAVPRLNAAQRQELELLYQHCARPCSDLLQQLIKDRPLLSQLDLHLLKAWFHSRRLKEKRDIKLSPLIHKNAELKAEHEALLIRNNQLKNQAFLLNLENRHLKEQLELQLPSQPSASLFVPEQPELPMVRDSSDGKDGENGTLCEVLRQSRWLLHEMVFWCSSDLSVNGGMLRQCCCPLQHNCNAVERI